MTFSLVAPSSTESLYLIVSICAAVRFDDSARGRGLHDATLFFSSCLSASSLDELGLHLHVTGMYIRVVQVHNHSAPQVLRDYVVCAWVCGSRCAIGERKFCYLRVCLFVTLSVTPHFFKFP